MRNRTHILCLIAVLIMSLLATKVMQGQATKHATTQPAASRDWPPMVHFVGKGGRQFGSTWPLSQVPRVGEKVKLVGLVWTVTEVEWSFDESEQGASLLQGDCKVVVSRRK